MSSEHAVALVAGMLHLAGTGAGILSVASSIDADDYLTRAASDANRVRVAAFAQVVMAMAYGAIPLVLYPLLRRHGEVLALGFLGLQLAAVAFVLLGAMLLLVLLALVRHYDRGRRAATPLFEEVGGLVRHIRDLVNHLATVLLLALAALPYYSLLLRAGLVPRWLPIWGLLGASLAIAASALFERRVVAIRSASYVGLVLPFAIQQLVLAMWLVVFGFDA